MNPCLWIDIIYKGYASDGQYVLDLNTNDDAYIQHINNMIDYFAAFGDVVVFHFENNEISVVSVKQVPDNPQLMKAIDQAMSNIDKMIRDNSDKHDTLIAESVKDYLAHISC